ncbi:MAG: hypothetical protein M3Y08_01385 [Fibrobacterota bacterium]|nr:hypothetical protein [Fibrobacterota bacterium]
MSRFEIIENDDGVWRGIKVTPRRFLWWHWESMEFLGVSESKTDYEKRGLIACVDIWNSEENCKPKPFGKGRVVYPAPVQEGKP